MKEIEIRNRDTGAGGDAKINTINNNNSSSRSAGMKPLKLPSFNEYRDDALLKCVKSTGQHSWLGYYRAKTWMYINDSQQAHSS